MHKPIAGLAVAAVLFGARAMAQDTQIVVPPAVVVPPLPANANVRPFGFNKLVIKLTLGQIWLSPHRALFCDRFAPIPWKGGQEVVKSAQFVDTFRAEMKAAGFKVDGADDNIFEESSSDSDVQLGGIMNDIKIDYCGPYIEGAALPRNVIQHAVVGMKWQIYSSVRREVIASIDTRGGVELRASASAGTDALLLGAFKENVRALMASDVFRTAVAGPPVQAADLAAPASQSIIPLAGSLASRPRPISDAVASVVMIRAGGGMGSGFLVSSDGLLITDRHVVGDAATVGVRWSDGIETVGTVVRINKVRDVALVKTDPRDRRPLSLRRELLQPGDGVFAIGAPLEARYQNTVSHGVVSAYRTSGGLQMIQSDVFVNHGNSGGPLLDEKGEVVGITESGVSSNGERQAISFFTPIGDALDFLKAERR